MSLFDWFRQCRDCSRPRELNEWYHVTFDDQRVRVRAEPPGRQPWTQEFTWASVERIAFKAEELETSDGIYVFTSERPESYAIPTEADGGGELWDEILRRGLFDPELAIKAACSPEGLFVWSPESSEG